MNSSSSQIRLPHVPNHASTDPAPPIALPLFAQSPLVILDGELVADENRDTGNFHLNYLAYDLIDVGTDPRSPSPFVDLPFRKRWEMIQSHVVNWRRYERGLLEKTRQKVRWWRYGVGVGRIHFTACPRERQTGWPGPSAPQQSSDRRALQMEKDAAQELRSKGRPGRVAAALTAFPRYDYSKEPIRVLRKEFWELPRTGWVASALMPTLAHECDGFIYQSGTDVYVPDTHHRILKWKFSHLNSVDFQVRVDRSAAAGAGMMLCALENRGVDELRAAGLEDRKRGSIYPTGKFMLPDGVASPERLQGSIVECVWDPAQRGWKYLRERTDKTTPNAWTVYESVTKSIEQNISVDELIAIGDAKGKGRGGDGGEGQGAGGERRANEPGGKSNEAVAVPHGGGGER